MNEYNEYMEDKKQPDNRTRNIVLGGVAAIVVLCGCLVVAVAAILAIDPFGWNLFDQLFGGVDAAAKAMPADTGIFVGMDLLELTPDKIGRVVNPFLAVAGEPDMPDFDTGLDEFDTMMLEELGFTFQDDILPWLGRYGGFGISNLVFDDFGDPEQVTWSLVIATRDEDASDAFMTKLRDKIAEESGYDFVTSTYDDVTIYELNAPDSLERVAMARDDGLLIFGAGAAAIQANIDAQSGDSLADNESYSTLEGELPGKRALTFYVDASLYESLQQELEGELPMDVDPADIPGLGAASVAFSISLTGDGLQFDTASLVDRESMSQSQQEMVDAMFAEPVTDQLFPTSTVVYLSGQRLDLVWASIRDSLSTVLDPEEFDESMDLFAEEMGINPDTELFPLLDGEWALGVVPSNAGLLAEEMDVSLGAAMLAHTSNPDSLSTNLGAFSNALAEQFLFVEPAIEGDLTTYTVREDPQGSPLFNFGIGQGYMFISTDNDTTARIFADDPSLADSDRYRDVWKAFPSKMAPAFYLDLKGLLGAIREGIDPVDLEEFNEVAQFFEPIPHIAVAVDSGEEVLHTTGIIFITGVDQ